MCHVRTRLAGRTIPEPNRTAAVDRLLGIAPAVLRFVKVGCRQAFSTSTSPSTRTPTSRIRARSRPSARTADGRPRRSPGTDVGGIAQGRDRVIVGEVGEPHLDARPCGRQPAVRIRAGRALGQPQQLAADHPGSSTSAPKVSSAPMLLLRLARARPGARRAPGQRRAGARRRPGRARAERRAAGCGRCRRRCAARGGAAPPRSCSPPPTGRRPAAGAGSRRPRSRGTTSSPSGLAGVEASLATNLVGATPTEQVMPCSSGTGARIVSPISAGRPSSRPAPATSRNASSRESGSTSGVTERNISMTPADTAE